VQIPLRHADKQEETAIQETGSQGLVENEAHKAGSGNDEAHTVIVGGTLQLLWCNWELPYGSKLLEICPILMLSDVKQKKSEAKHAVHRFCSYMELLCEGTAPDKGHLEPGTGVGLKSRMRENRTYGSVRGNRQAFHVLLL
jgi:hypothetical protein